MSKSVTIESAEGARRAEVIATGSAAALTVAVVDASGNQITTFGGGGGAGGSGTEYTEDAASAANPAGPMSMARRRDSLSTETTTDGDNTALNATGKGELYVKHVDVIPVNDNGGSLTVDGVVAATQSGAWNITNVSGTVSLPTGAATSANQTNGSQKTQITDGAGVVNTKQLGSQITTSDVGLIAQTVIHGWNVSGSQYVDVKVNPSGALNAAATQDGIWNITNVSGTVSLPTGAATSANQTSTNTKLDSLLTELQLKADLTETQPISAASLPLPSGAATSALQSTIDASINTLLKPASTLSAVTTVETITNVVHVDDNGSTISIDDGAGSITVDNTNLDVALSTRLKAADTLAGVTTVGAVTSITNALPAGTNAIGKLAANDGVDIGDVTINNASGASAVNIQDGGNSITVDGTVAATQSGTWILGANSGVDIGDVTINNASGASAVNIQDGGNSITVDGTVAATNANLDVALSTLATSSNQTNGSQKTQIVDGSGNVISSVLDIDSERHLAVSIIQDINLLASSTSNLAQGAAYTSTGTSNLNVDAIQMNFIADQDCVIQVQQSPDNTNWDYETKFTAYAAKSESRTINASGSYARVVVTNIGNGTTTYLRLQIFAVPHMNPMPNETTSSGNLKTAVREALPAGSNLIGKVLTYAAQDSEDVDILKQILNELRGMRMAIVMMATEGRRAVPDDFVVGDDDEAIDKSSILN